MKNKEGGIFLIFIMCTSCASLNNKTIVSGAVGFLSCSAIGAATAPEDEKPEMHALMWGSACSSAGMLISELILNQNEDKKTKEKLMNMRTEDSIEELKIKNSILNSSNYENLDIETKNKLKGKWSIYKIDNWILDGEKLKHENFEVEFE